MATVIEELLLEIGIDVDDKSIEQFNKVTETTIKTLKRVTIVAGAAGAAIVAYTVKMAGATDENAKFAEQNGVAFSSLQELGFAAEREGASLDSLKSSLSGLTRAAGEASMGTGAGVEAFARLGINIMDVNGQIKTADALMTEISGSMQGMQRAEQVDLISKLGISQDMLLLLQKGTGNMESLRKEARKYGIESERMAKSGQDFQDNMTNLKASIFGALIPLRQFVLDLANNFLPKISDWIAKNRQLIKGKFVEYLQTIIKAFKTLIKVVNQFMPLIKAMGISIVAFKALNFAKSIFLTGKAMWALVPAITGVTGGLNLLIPLVALIIGGLATWFKESEQGGQVFEYAMERINKALGRLSEKFIGFLNSFGLSVKDAGELWDKYLAPALEWLVTGVVVTAVEAIVAVIDLVSMSFKGWGLIIKSVVDDIKRLVGWVEKINIGKKLGSFSTRVSQEFDIVKGFLGFGEDTTQPTPAPRASATGGGNTSNSNTVNATIEVSSASGDPNAIGQAVKDALTSVARNGIENQTVTVLA